MNPVHKNNVINVVGAGLAGSECALQLANFGHKVNLIEMRPKISTAAHKTAGYAELVCSNSFGSLNEWSAPGQLKWEAEKLDSQILQAAKEAHVPAGQALGVDREKLSNIISEKIHNHKNIHVQNVAIEKLDQLEGLSVIATGPLTYEPLAQDILKHFGNDFCYFFDAIAPIVSTDSIDFEKVWRADRYDKGTPDYINCPFDKEQYFSFVDEIIKARKIEPKHFETTPFFEGCMPIETMAERGIHTLRFGPMKPVGLKNPKTGRDPFAVVQLRAENKMLTSYNLVGFQTRMAYPEQQRVFKMIPGLENAEFLKLGSIHRNLYINSPSQLNKDLSSKHNPNIYFAGQITGVEGYFESTCIGILVANFIHQKVQGNKVSFPSSTSAFGSLLQAITDADRAKNFQPTNINFGLMPPLSDQDHLENPTAKRDKDLKKKIQILKARQSHLSWIEQRM